ncbi:Hypothetical predicted protein [Pelobates cultripes]|uniref:L1 transposable element RRM domain-containing protein n=1 Tax=Pelobates cultripes TaxID=61616 RepID=A0AAD1SYF4_PELCU|nr:Hypothetical predicted protein [Pelobates cultripes]
MRSLELKIKSETDYLHAKVNELEDRSRQNNIGVKVIPDSIQPKELEEYLKAKMRSVCPNLSDKDLKIDRIHRLLKPNSAPQDAPKDRIARIHFFTVKEDFLLALRTSDLPNEYKHIKVFQDISPITMQRRREFSPFTAELHKLNIRNHWGFPVKVLFGLDGQQYIITIPEEGMEVIHTLRGFDPVIPAHRSPLTPPLPRKIKRREALSHR